MSLQLLTPRPESPLLPGKRSMIAIVLLASIFPLTLVPRAHEDRPGKDGQFSGKQGQVLWVDVPVRDAGAKVVGRFLKREVPFFPTPQGTQAALVGIDMQDAPGLHELSVTATLPDRTRHFSLTILVMKETYPLQRLTLPKRQVDLDHRTLVRVKAEQRTLRAAFEAVAPHPFWEGPFIEPVKGRISGRFGSRRIINGQPRSPHSGEDIAAPLGTPVAAMNTGVVRLTIDHFFTGKGVILDHGLGLYSMYFHLSEISVHEGQRVDKGTTIGKVGATGRASGPHLHWGVRLNGSRVDPYALIRLPITS